MTNPGAQDSPLLAKLVGVSAVVIFFAAITALSAAVPLGPPGPGRPTSTAVTERTTTTIAVREQIAGPVILRSCAVIFVETVFSDQRRSVVFELLTNLGLPGETIETAVSASGSPVFIRFDSEDAAQRSLPDVRIVGWSDAFVAELETPDCEE